MTDVPSNYNHRLVKLLGKFAEKFANDPRARRIQKAMDYEKDLDALGKYITDGFEDASHLEEGTAKASVGYYKRLSREIVQLSILYPGDAAGFLERMLFLIEVVAVGRTDNFKEKLAAH